MTTATTEIHTRALLVWLTISTWSARKYDKQISQKVNADYNAASDASRTNKMLLPGDAESYKALIHTAGQIRQAHYANTLAWSDEGWRLLPVANYCEYTNWLRHQQSVFQAALDQFVYDYPSLRHTARLRLGAMYNDSDYPQSNDIRQRFDISVSYMPVPAQGDIRVDLASDQISSIEASIQSKLSASVDSAMRDAWTRLHSVTSHIVERLTDPTAVFRDTLITNARECCEMLRRLNVTDDPQLESMRAAVESNLAACDPDDLRDDKYMRANVAAKAQSILDQMKDVYGMVAA